MTITVSISREVEEKLRERAAASGVDIAQYAAEVLKLGVAGPTIEEILAAARADVANAGLSDDEFMALGRTELAALRAEKKQERT